MSVKPKKSSIASMKPPQYVTTISESTAQKGHFDTHKKLALMQVFLMKSYPMSLKIKNFCEIIISKCSEKIFDLARQVFEKFKLF